MAKARNELHYYVPDPSAYPAVVNAGLFFLALGFVLKLNSLALATQSLLLSICLDSNGKEELLLVFSSQPP